jgi:hypothetical protein
VAGALLNDNDTAVHLDGTAALVAGVDYDFGGVKPFSLEAWFAADTDATSFRYIFRAEDFPDGSHDGMGVYLLAAQGLAFFRYAASGVTGAGAPTPSLGTYTHVVATYDSTAMDLYVNGTHIGNAPQPSPRIGISSMAMGEGFVGSLDEIAIYDHALDLGRVRAHFTASGR